MANTFNFTLKVQIYDAAVDDYSYLLYFKSKLAHGLLLFFLSHCIS